MDKSYPPATHSSQALNSDVASAGREQQAEKISNASLVDEGNCSRLCFIKYLIQHLMMVIMHTRALS